MKEAATKPLALVVRQAPYAQRSARTQLDAALAAASLDLPLEVYFLGDAIWQLAAKREVGAAGLPRGLRGWAAVGDLTKAVFFVDARRLRQLQEQGVETVVAVTGLKGPEMAGRWQACSQVMSL